MLQIILGLFPYHRPQPGFFRETTGCLFDYVLKEREKIEGFFSLLAHGTMEIDEISWTLHLLARHSAEMTVDSYFKSASHIQKTEM